MSVASVEGPEGAFGCHIGCHIGPAGAAAALAHVLLVAVSFAGVAALAAAQGLALKTVPARAHARERRGALARGLGAAPLRPPAPQTADRKSVV